MATMPTTWLLEGPAWVRFRTRIDLLGESETSPRAVADRAEMIADPAVGALVARLAEWDGAVISSHKSAGQTYHILAFLADLGLCADDPGMPGIVERVMAHQSDQGPFQLKANISPTHGGTGSEAWGWALCDAPVVVYALARLGLSEHPAVARAGSAVWSLQRDNGWPCAVSPELGSFRGPGRKGDPCPYATLVALRALTAFSGGIDTSQARIGANVLLDLWEHSRDRHPYIFYMGTDFRKLKVPLVWYDLLHVMDVLSQIPGVSGDSRYRSMLDELAAKADGDGHFCCESVWKAWADWEFGQKREPSRWATLLAWRILMRSGCA